MTKENVKESPREARAEETLLVGQNAVAIRMLRVRPHERPCTAQGKRWGVILAGGDGTRLQRLARLICGDDRPKQFCPLIGNETLLEQTRQRAERSIPPEQILVPVTRSHRAFYLQERGIRPSQRIVQPANKGTGLPILYCLLSIEHNDDDALVAILPCDHHYSDEPAFTAALESAFDCAARHPDSVVLLGALPQGPEVEYGCIELGPPAGCASFQVRRFCEKPPVHVARELIERGSLWNTFVMVGHVRGFLEMVNGALMSAAEELRASPLWAGAEVDICDSLYERLHAVDFSKEVLSVQTNRLVALRMAHTGWSDLGHPDRVVAVLRETGLEPWWMQAWQTPRESPAIVERAAHSAIA